MLLELLDGSHELESKHVSRSALLDAMQREAAQAAVSVPFTLQTVQNWQQGPGACAPLSWHQIAHVLQVRSCQPECYAPAVKPGPSCLLLSEFVSC